MPFPSPEQISKLPQHVQRYISSLQQRAEAAESALYAKYEAAEPTAITFEPTIDLTGLPHFLKPDPVFGGGRDYSQVKFWLLNTRWRRHATHDFFEVTRGSSHALGMTSDEIDRSMEDSITINAADGKILVQPVSSSEITLSYRRR